MKKFSLVALALAAFSPMFAYAQLGNIGGIVEAIGGLIELATPIVVGLALLAFFWGLVKYIFSAGDDDKASGKSLMIGGIIAIFVMVSVVGIVGFIGEAVGVRQGGNLPVPGVQN